uniref:J domain-containing protein n=2 Tax=Babesia bovis TaxID=5865 RepID=A7ANG3_BABBO|eukprot:XP_001611665.1 hypothetical protein [Babesia bovis T2Bo]
MEYSKKEKAPYGNTTNRLHEYLRDLRWGMSSTYDDSQNKSQKQKKNENASVYSENHPHRQAHDAQKKETNDPSKRESRLRGTVPDSQFAEKSATCRRRRSPRSSKYEDYTSILYETALDEVFKMKEFVQDEFMSSQRYMGRESETSTDDESPMILEHEIHFADPVSTVGSESGISQENSTKSNSMYTNSYPDKVLKPQYSQESKSSANEFEVSPSVDVKLDHDSFDSKEFNAQTPPVDHGCHALAQSLRTIANQLESMPMHRIAHQRSLEELCKVLARDNHLKHEELLQLQNQITVYDEEKRKLEDKVINLEAEIKRLSNHNKEVRQSDESKETENHVDREINELETLPPVTKEYSDFTHQQRAFIKSLQSSLYIGSKQSSSPTFQAELYRDIRAMPDVVNCRQLVEFINGGIRSDADVLHTRIKHSALKHGVKRIFVEEHLSPFTNRYPYPSEFEQLVIAEMENSHPNRRFSMDPAQSNDLHREQMGIVLNRVVLRSIFKYSHIHNLYNYLFIAMYSDNFRVCDILKEGILHRFLDFQMVPNYAERIRHPVMWSFGDSCNSTQSYRYLKMLEFDFEKFPSDPHDGENLWHRIVKGDAIAVAQALKPYSIHTDYMYKPNQRGETPLDIAKGKMRKELLGLAVVEIASKGSNKYKEDDFEGALTLYCDAITKQLEALSISAPTDSLQRDVNLGKLYYNKARSLMHLDRWTETVEACELCIEHIPNYTNAYVTCIQAYEKLLDWDNAVKTCYLMRENCGVVDDEKMAALRSQIGATMFQILGLPSTASPREIKQAFNQLCKQWHPDKFGKEPMNADIKRRAMNQFNRLYEAREKLLDDGTRIVEQSRPETQYNPPDPMIESSRKYSDNGDPNSAKIEPLQNHLSKLKSESQNETVVDENLIQNAMDHLQHQIDGMSYTKS